MNDELLALRRRRGSPAAAAGDRLPFAEQLLEDLVDRVAGRVVELLEERLPAPVEASPWLNVEEAAEYLRCKSKRIYDLVSQHRLTAHRDGSRLLFRHEDLDAYLDRAPAD